MGAEEFTQLTTRMREEWDRRIAHDYRYWMSDGVASDEEMWRVGERDFNLLFSHYPREDAQGQCAVEIGCGVGRLLRPASFYFQRVIGVDVSAQAIERARLLLSNQKNVECVLGNGIDLQPIPDQSVDVVFSFAAFGSMPMQVVANYLAESSRILTLGGTCRFQLFLGREQSICAEDTLSVRGIVQERLEQAASLLGLSLMDAEELQMPFEVSDREAGLIASLVVLQKVAHHTTSRERVLAALSSQPERIAGEQWRGSPTEYLMALYRADEHLNAGRVEEARLALEFAVRHYQDAEGHVKELLAKLQHGAWSDEGWSDHEEKTLLLQLSSAFEKNLQHLQVRFPRVAEGVPECSTLSEFSVESGSSGAPVLMWQGRALDQLDKPQKAAELWAEQNAHRVRNAKSVILIGLGSGYVVEELRKRTTAKLHLALPNSRFLSGAFMTRDCRAALDNLSSISFSLSELREALAGTETPEIVIHPQALLYGAGFIDEVRSEVWGMRGLRELHPSIAVIGPIYGGTLPIASYTSDALTALKQRTYGIQLDSFYPPYSKIQKAFREKRRGDAIESQFVDFLSQLILEQLSERPVDIVISMAQAPLKPTVLTELRNRGVITVQWFMEDCRRFTSWEHIARHYDYLFVIQREFCALVEQAGAGRSIYLPVGCDPNVHHPQQLTEEERFRWGSDLSFLGAGYNNRQQMFAGLASRNFKIWGTDWPQGKPFDRLVQEQGRRLSPSEYVKIFAASKINLNLHSSSERDGVEPDGDFVNPRTFELAASGAFQLVDERKHLHDLFRIGEEIVTFRNRKELEDQVDYYLAHPVERQEFALKARARALREHTYEHRLRTMLSHIYADRFEELRSRQGESPWKRTLERASAYPDLLPWFERLYDRGEEPALEGIVGCIQEMKGTLSEAEQKLLFLHHVKSQIENMQSTRHGS